MNCIEINNLSKVYRTKKWKTVKALDNLNLSIESGEVFGFLGPNGAGKSTTIKCLMGLIQPSSGSARLLGEPVGSVSSRQNIGYLPENPAFYDYLTAEEYLQFVGKMFDLSAAQIVSRTNEVLNLLEIGDARRRPIRSYSKGMVQRIGLGQTLIHDPELYVFDEPMSGLDPIGRALVKEIILNLKKRGKTVFFSTHITDDVEKICDRVGIIRGGELKSVERIDTILTTGITGYVLHVCNKNGQVEVLTTDKCGLDKVLDEIRLRGDEIRLIEPQRRNLENFFLDIVRDQQK